MKLYRLLFIISIAMLPLLYGCPKTKNVTTNINRDGSCTRTIGEFDPRDFEGIDSVKRDLQIPIDSSWSLKTINDSTAILSKNFNSVDELNQLYSIDESAYKSYARDVELEKNFRWFHTQYIYQESYGGIFTKLPLSNYLSEKEVKIFKMEDAEKSPFLNEFDQKARKSLLDNIEKRADLWLNDNLMAIFIDEIMKIAIEQQIIIKEDIDIEVVFDSVKLRNDRAKNMFFKLDFGDDYTPIKELVTATGIELKLDSTMLEKLINKVKLADLESIFDSGIFASLTDEYNNELLMPGLLVDTNADKIRGDTLYWDVNFIKFMDNDYIMIAESKVTNNWAYLISGFILAIALLIPFLKRRKA